MSVILRDDNNATATLVEGTGYPLGDVAGDVTLDEGRAPHGICSLTIPAPTDPELVELLDPRAHRRVRVDITQERLDGFGSTDSRAFDLGLRGVDLDEMSATMRLDLATDEALLMDDVLLADTPDVSGYANKSSLRAVVNGALARIGATLDPGTTDAPVSVLADARNMLSNPTAQIDLTDTGSFGLTSLVRQTGTGWSPYNTAFRLNGSAGNAGTFLYIGGDQGAGGIRNGMRAGGRYRVTGTIRFDAVMTGTADGRARRIVVFYAQNGRTTPYEIRSDQAPNAAGTYRLSLDFELPNGTTQAWIRFYHGHASTQAVYWHSTRLSEWTPDPTDTAFFDGDTTDTADYEYSWVEATGKSVSIRTALRDESPAALEWQPGVSAWDFLGPIVQAAGMRLLCDEQRRWLLVDGAAYLAPGVTQLALGVTILDASTSVNRDGDWFDAALVRYRWRDANGQTQERIDWYAEPGYTKARVFDIDAPFPGPGRAEYKVKRAAGLGRTASVQAPLDLAVTPSQALRIELPNLPDLFGVTRSVRFDLNDFSIRVESRGLTDVPPDAWVLVKPDLTWAATPPLLEWQDANPDDSTIFD